MPFLSLMGMWTWCPAILHHKDKSNKTAGAWIPSQLHSIPFLCYPVSMPFCKPKINLPFCLSPHCIGSLSYAAEFAA
jgi:hypothetical protein